MAELPLLIRPLKQYTKGVKTSLLKQCAILKFVILYIKYLLPVSLNMSICNFKTNTNDNTEINACLKGGGGGRIFKREILLFKYTPPNA